MLTFLCILFNILTQYSFLRSYPNISGCGREAMHSHSLWSEQHLQRSWKQPCLLMPGRIPRSTAGLPTRVCFQFRMCSDSGLHQFEMPRSMSRHMWPERTVSSYQPQPTMCMPFGLHRRPINWLSNNTE